MIKYQTVIFILSIRCYMGILIFVMCLWAFFLGTIPTGYFAGRFKKIDIQNVGSGNVGATNVFRTIGAIPGFVVLALDVFKGYIASTVITYLFYNLARGLPINTTAISPLILKMAFGASAIIGNIWNPFLGFKGGKGVATSLGVILAIDSTLGIYGLALFSTTLFIGRYVSLGSLIAISGITIISFATGRPLTISLFLLAICSIISIKHIPNIDRLAKGIESKIKNPHK